MNVLSQLYLNPQIIGEIAYNGAFDEILNFYSIQTTLNEYNHEGENTIYGQYKS